MIVKEVWAKGQGAGESSDVCKFCIWGVYLKFARIFKFSVWILAFLGRIHYCYVFVWHPRALEK